MLWECGENAVPILCKKFCLYCLYHWLSGSFEQCHRVEARLGLGTKWCERVAGDFVWTYVKIFQSGFQVNPHRNHVKSRRVVLHIHA